MAVRLQHKHGCYLDVYIVQCSSLNVKEAIHNEPENYYLPNGSGFGNIEKKLKYPKIYVPTMV